MKENLLNERKQILKLIILTLLFTIALGLASTVNAATRAEKITMIEGLTETINPGITTDWGGIKKINIKNNTASISVKQVGKQSKNPTIGKDSFTIMSKDGRTGTCEIEVQYMKNFYSLRTTKTYIVTVQEKSVESISVKTMPKITKYTVDDKLNENGLSINVNYDNGEAKVISAGLECSPMKLSKVGTQEITIVYKGVKTKFNVEVEEKKIAKKETTNKTVAQTTTNTKVYTNKLKVGDFLKLKDGSGWYVYKKADKSSSRSIITGGTTITVSKIDKNWITIKENETYKYIYYGSTAAKYFSKVSTNSNSSNSKELVDSNGKTIKVGDTIKMTKGSKWWIYTNSKLNTTKTTIKVGSSYKIVSIDEHTVGIDFNGKTCYIKWYNSTTGARNYFTIQ